MDQNKKLERISLAIQELIEGKRNKEIIQSHDDDAENLSRLLSELEELKGEGMLRQSEDSSGRANEEDDGQVDDSSLVLGCGTDEIARELKKIKRQNFVTHCLLSVVIVLTVVWQLSEVSLVMKVRDGLNHPFRAFGSMLTGMLKPRQVNGNESDNKEHQHEPSTQVESSSLNIED